MNTPLPLALDKKGKPKYLQLADGIREAIKSSVLLPGSKLCSARVMAGEYQLNRHTVMNALQLLVAEGWLESFERSSYTVTHSLPIEHSISGSSVDKVAPITYQFACELPPITEANQLSEYHYNFAGGLPDLQLFPYVEFKRAMSYVCSHLCPDDLHYGQISGCNNLKVQLAHYLAQARGLKAQDLLVCNGSQEALFLIAKAFIKPGDIIAAETLGYPPVRKVFNACGAQLVDIKQDTEGLCVEDLKVQLKRYKIKLLYLTPLHQYPTTVTLSPSRRMQIYQLCYTHGVMIIEDDYDHEFHYKCHPLQPMAADDPAGIVIYLSTFSKIMFSAARIGYIIAAPKVIAQLTAWKQLINHKNDVLTQLAVAHWMKEGGFARHLKKMTKLYRQRLEYIVEQLTIWQAQGQIIDYQIPDGGMAMWVKISANINEFKERLQKQGIYVQTEDEFYYTSAIRSLAPKLHDMNYIRLGFAGQNSVQIKQGLELIFKKEFI